MFIELLRYADLCTIKKRYDLANRERQELNKNNG